MIWLSTYDRITRKSGYESSDWTKLREVSGMFSSALPPVLQSFRRAEPATSSFFRYSNVSPDGDTAMYLHKNDIVFCWNVDRKQRLEIDYN
jgi:hypothetical protein